MSKLKEGNDIALRNPVPKSFQNVTSTPRLTNNKLALTPESAGTIIAIDLVKDPGICSPSARRLDMRMLSNVVTLRVLNPPLRHLALKTLLDRDKEGTTAMIVRVFAQKEEEK
ncbi:hypothetical protein F5146DRAFT_1149698 [Armillaria mellea]|nr:hypothetical protein F5146DRAFT_1149698 [Armillaria mellea]